MRHDKGLLTYPNPQSLTFYGPGGGELGVAGRVFRQTLAITIMANGHEHELTSIAVCQRRSGAVRRVSSFLVLGLGLDVVNRVQGLDLG